MDPENQLPLHVGIVGASARSAAFSSLRAGLTPVCWDLYQDVDLQAVARIESLTQLGDAAPIEHTGRVQLPLMHVGGMENHPDWLEEAARTGPLWATDPAQIRRVRNPVDLYDVLTALRLKLPEIRTSDSPPDADGTWLLKPLKSGGGRGIVLWTPDVAGHATLNEPHFFQKFVKGQPYSAVFVGIKPPGDVNFVGITRQLVGAEALHAPPFAWCGSVGPAALEMHTEHMIRRFGNILQWKFELRGLFGCDFIVDDEGAPWLTEVNPRYPASVEILELACGFTLMRSHAQSFGVNWAAPNARFDAWSERVLAKGVLYAPHALVMPEVPASRMATPCESVNRIADVTPAGAVVQKGEPVCTLIVDGADDASATDRLFEAANNFLATTTPA